MKNTIKISFLLIVFASMGCSKSDRIIGLNQDIRHDDFAYRVTSFQKRKSLQSDSGSRTAQGIFLIVTFEVENRALRVSHDWDNNIAYISEGRHKIENDTAVQRLLDRSEPFQWKDHYMTRHGETESTRLVFDIPENMAKPCLQVRGYMLMGDVFNLNRFKRIKIKLY